MKRPALHPDAGISIDNMRETVRYLTTLDPARNHNNIASLNKAAEFTKKRFREYGIAASEQYYGVSNKIYSNVIASIGPEGGSRLIVGAHYDVAGDQPGADDNASGIAGLLEIARFCKQHESELRHRVDFVAYSLEEPPHFGTQAMGSYIHAESLSKAKTKVKGMICLEMIGYYSDKPKSQSYPSMLLRPFYPSKGNFIGVISNFGSSSFAKEVARHISATSVPIRTLKAPSFIEGVDFSDHRNYWKFGYDAVMITDTSFYRNANYHRKTDTMDTLDFSKMQEVVKGICWSILNIQ